MNNGCARIYNGTTGYIKNILMTLSLRTYHRLPLRLTSLHLIEDLNNGRDLLPADGAPAALVVRPVALVAIRAQEHVAARCEHVALPIRPALAAHLVVLLLLHGNRSERMLPKHTVLGI